jgi:hypothetical protein
MPRGYFLTRWIVFQKSQYQMPFSNKVKNNFSSAIANRSPPQQVAQISAFQVWGFQAGEGFQCA